MKAILAVCMHADDVLGFVRGTSLPDWWLGTSAQCSLVFLKRKQVVVRYIEDRSVDARYEAVETMSCAARGKVTET